LVKINFINDSKPRDIQSFVLWIEENFQSIEKEEVTEIVQKVNF
jgi:hypothetical protein